MTYYFLVCSGLIIHLFNYIDCSKELKFTAFFFIAYINNNKDVQEYIFFKTIPFLKLYKIRGSQSINMDLYSCIMYLFCVCCFQTEVVCLNQTFSVSNFQISFTFIIFKPGNDLNQKNCKSNWFMNEQDNSLKNKCMYGGLSKSTDCLYKFKTP